MQVGLIAPPPLLEKCCITNIHYCLPILISKNKKYRSFYTRKALEGEIVILDCRKIGWKRTPEDPKICLDAIERLTPTIIILPSVMHSRKRTLEKSLQFLTYHFQGMKAKFVYCAEGTNPKELRDSAKDSKELPVEVFTVAIASHSHRLCTDLKYPKPLIYIENHQDVRELAHVPEGVLLTSLPVRLGLSGRLLSNYSPTPSHLTFRESGCDFPEIVKKNISDTLEIYRGGNNSEM